jgi:uncharacterized protein YndB with AHSA1/START domain
MEQTSNQPYDMTSLALNIEKYPLVELTRNFAAPVERLWKAWTTPEMMKQWWGPEQFTCPEARMDVREGGKAILAMKGPDGKIQYSGGTYEEIIPHERLVMTDQFTDQNGNFMSAQEVGMGGDWPDTMRVTIEFESLNPHQSQIHIVHQGIPKVAHEDCVAGWSSSLEKLKRLVEHV